VTGLYKAFFVPFFDGEGVAIPVSRDEKFIKTLISQEMAFFSSLINFQSPEPSDRDWVELYDSEALEKATKYKFLDARIKECQREMDEIKQEILKKVKSPRMSVNGVKIQKIFRSGNIDYKAIPELKNINLEIYRKPSSEYWKITV
jgi:predicted transcriptional regulator